MSLKPFIYIITKQYYSCMEKYWTFFNYNKHKRPSHHLISPIKINQILLQSSIDDPASFSALMKKTQHQQITQAIKNSEFTYQSMFQVKNLFKDQPNSPMLLVQKETFETQAEILQVEKKGFSFIQYPANKPIEDSICSFFIQQLSAFVVSVFDGHGGSQLSRFCAKNISRHLNQFIKNSVKLQKYQNNKIQLIKDGLQQAYSSLQNQYYKNHYLKKIKQDKKKYKGIGTCGITAVIYEGKCIVGTCGDSQSIVISQDRGSYNYEKLSQRFSVNNKAQRQRIINEFKDIDQNIVIQERKNVFYLKGMLQPTKSIGDYYLKHKQHYIGQDEFKGPYISYKPEIKVYDIKRHDKYIVIASDGLWDYFNKWQIVKHVIQSKKDKLSIAQRQTQSQNQDQNETKPTSTQQYLVDKILQKVSNDFDLDVNYLKSLQLGQRRSYHDDVTIGIINLSDFFQNYQKKLFQS